MRHDAGCPLRNIQQVAVKLLDVIFGEVNRVCVRKDCFHDFRVTGDFLLVAACKGFDLKIGEQRRAIQFHPISGDNRSTAGRTNSGSKLWPPFIFH